MQRQPQQRLDETMAIASAFIGVEPLKIRLFSVGAKTKLSCPQCRQDRPTWEWQLLSPTR